VKLLNGSHACLTFVCSAKHSTAAQLLATIVPLLDEVIYASVTALYLVLLLLLLLLAAAAAAAAVAAAIVATAPAAIATLLLTAPSRSHKGAHESCVRRNIHYSMVPVCRKVQHFTRHYSTL
jgi:hypothetical protein